MTGKFTPEDDEVLIDLVRQNPPLYSVGGKSYKEMVVKNNIWKEIGAIMKKNEKACQTRWKNIRDYYQKKKREAMKKKKTGPARNIDVENFGTKYKHLSFLDNTSIVETRSISNLNEKSFSIFVEPQDLVDESEAALSNMGDYQEMIDNKTSISIETFSNTQESHEDQEPNENQSKRVEEPTTSATIPSKRRRKSVPEEQTATVVEEFERGLTERNQLFVKDLLWQPRNKTKEDDTPISMFFRSIALTVEQLPPDLQTRAKVKVMQAISELEFEHQQRTMTDCYRCASTGLSYSVKEQKYLSIPDQSRPSSVITSPPYLSPIDQPGPSSEASYM